jgi:type III restriction enzyme
VEYKGDAYATNDDSKEKRALGELWEKRSNGNGLYLFAEKSVEGSNVASQLTRKLR